MCERVGGRGQEWGRRRCRPGWSGCARHPWPDGLAFRRQLDGELVRHGWLVRGRAVREWVADLGTLLLPYGASPLGLGRAEWRNRPSSTWNLVAARLALRGASGRSTLLLTVSVGPPVIS